MKNEEEFTSVRLSKRNRDRLADHGKKKETFDQIVDRLIQFWEQNH